MAVSSIFFITLFCLSIVKATHATNATPYDNIRYPFHIKGLKPKPDQAQAHLPAFELLRNSNNATTIIHFPSYGELVVKSISYQTNKIYLLDPNDCVHRVFLNLDLSLTPFRYYHLLKNYTYLNCSTALPQPFAEITCLSGSGSHVYTVDPELPVPASCDRIGTVAIPFQYSPYLSGNSLGLELNWELPQSQDSHTPRSYTVLGLLLLVAIALTVSGIKGNGSYSSETEKEGRLLQQSLPYV